MQLADVFEQIQENDRQGDVALHWDDSMACMPDVLPFLEPDQIADNLEWGGLERSHQQTLEKAARQIAETPALNALAWHAWRRLYESEDPVDFNHWPTLDAAMNDASGCFYLLLGLAMVPGTRAIHESLGVPSSVTRETCLQVACFADNFRRGRHGRLGMFRGQLFWMRNYPQGRLFRLGRFEYRLQPLGPFVHVFRHRAQSLTVVLSADGRLYDDAGYAVQSGAAGSWQAAFTRSDEAARGFPVHPAGHVLRHEVTLPRSEWSHVVKPGDTMLDIHIPSGGQMTPQSCLDTMRRGVEFFQTYFPDKPFRSFWCHSWIFGPQLETILPETANLVKYMREVYLYPVYSEDGGLWFIFFQDQFDLATVPRENSLQRSVAHYLEKGKEWREGGMIALVDDLEQFGSQVYRSRWPEVANALGLPA